MIQIKHLSNEDRMCAATKRRSRCLLREEAITDAICGRQYFFVIVLETTEAGGLEWGATDLNLNW